METPTFKHQRNGYNRDIVDDFLKQVATGSLTAEQIAAQTFPTCYHGYNIAEVDAYLAKLKDTVPH